MGMVRHINAWRYFVCASDGDSVSIFAVGDRSVSALTDHAIKLPAKCFETYYVVVDGVEMLTGDRAPDLTS